MLRHAVLVALLAVPVAAQGPRTVAHFDGDPRERVRFQGRGRFVHDASSASEGLGAVRVEPGPDSPFYGVSVRDVPVRRPKKALLSIFQEGEQRTPYKVHVFDAASKGSHTDAAVKLVECSPGWSEVEIPLEGLRSYTDARDVDVAERLVELKISRAKSDDGNPAFVVDDLRVVGEELAGIRDEVKALLAAPPEARSAAALRGALLLLPETERAALAIEALRAGPGERVRRALRESLEGLVQEPAASALADAFMKARGSLRVELASSLAATGNPRVRERAIAFLRDSRIGVEERAALLAGLGRRGLGAAVAAFGESAAPARGPWPLRVALVHALRASADAGAVDGLIEVLRAPGSPRIAADAEEALAALTGKEIGADAEAWARWWREHRTDDAALTPGRSSPRAGAYAGFFGIPVPAGRIAFVLDTSGSMRDPVTGGRALEHVRGAPHLKGREVRSRLDLARAELLHAIDELPAGSFASVIHYNDDVLALGRGLEPANAAWKEKMRSRIEGLSAQERTNIHDGLFLAFHPNKKPDPRDIAEGPDTIFLLTDGNPSVGPITDRDELRDAVIRWCLGRRLKIHAVNVGDADSRMLRAIARATGGSFLDLTSERSDPEGEDDQ